MYPVSSPASAIAASSTETRSQKGRWWWQRRIGEARHVSESDRSGSPPIESGRCAEGHPRRQSRPNPLWRFVEVWGGSPFPCLEDQGVLLFFFHSPDGTTQTSSVGMSDDYGTCLPSAQLIRRDTCGPAGWGYAKPSVLQQFSVKFGNSTVVDSQSQSLPWPLE